MANAMLTAQLHALQGRVDGAHNEIANGAIVRRIWEHVYTVWRPDPDEISNRLGWLDIADRMLALYSQGVANPIAELVDHVRADGYSRVLLLGMGGSSLAPEVFRKTFGVSEGYLDLDVLDSTDPGAILNYDRQLDPARTLYIVSTKSGGTVETLSFFKYFYNRTLATVGQAQAGAHFVAITDPGSSLVELAQQYDFRATFVNDPNIGGRYSALSYFGLVPAALVGVDVPELLRRAVEMAETCKPRSSENPGAELGLILGEAARSGRNKVTFITSPSIASFGEWVEQLIAESTGKEGKGILPVVNEPPLDPYDYGDDRLFVYLHLNGEDRQSERVDALAARCPLVRLQLRDLDDTGGQMFLWEFAIAIAGHRMDIQPFDQPNVESAKVQARKMVDAYTKSGELPRKTPVLSENGVTVYADVTGDSLAGVVKAFFNQARAGDYVALQAYVTPNAATDAALEALRAQVLQKTHLATTLGYGPRFLHSTGQLHKGDDGGGLFIQFTADAVEDVAIPEKAGESQSSISFGVLILAQSMGDREALLENKRRVIRFHLGKDVSAGLRAVGQVL